MRNLKIPPVVLRLLIIIGLVFLWFTSAYLFSRLLVNELPSPPQSSADSSVVSSLHSHDTVHKKATQEPTAVPTFAATKATPAPTPAPVNNAKKVDWHQKLVTPFTPPGRKVCFVHIGKTAGSTLACYMGFRYPACGDNFPIPLGRLPRYTTNLMHTRLDDCAKNGNFEHYLFILRNPVARIISWFQYEKIKKGQQDSHYVEKAPLYVECYGTLNELAEQGLEETNGKEKTKCQKRAWMAIRGKVGYSAHNYYNFGFYLAQTPQDSKVLAIRTEHLNEDWNSAEEALGGKRKLETPFEKKNVSVKKEDALSEHATANLCNALCEEFQVYKQILTRALNLRPEDLAESMREVQESCPLEPTNIRSCSTGLDQPSKGQPKSTESIATKVREGETKAKGDTKF